MTLDRVSQDAELRPQDTVGGRYRLERVIGEGGMSWVWAATHTVTGKQVAIKVLKASRGDRTKRITREARVLARLEHPNVVTLFDAMEARGLVALAMDRLEGESLRARLRAHGALPPSEVRDVLAPVVRALIAAHEAHVVHRDLKPENIFLARVAGRIVPKVLDFGLAKWVSPDAAESAGTETGAILGTPDYMAPEQIYGERDVDERADAWSLGAVWFECLTGAKPFGADNSGQVFKRITMGPDPDWSSLPADTPVAWIETMTGLCERNRERRTSLRDALRVLEGEALRISDGELAPSTRTIAPMQRRANRALLSSVALACTCGLLVFAKPTAGRMVAEPLRVMAEPHESHAAAPSPANMTSRALGERELANHAEPAGRERPTTDRHTEPLRRDPEPAGRQTPSAEREGDPTGVTTSPEMRDRDRSRSTQPTAARKHAQVTNQATQRLPGGVHGESPY